MHQSQRTKFPYLYMIHINTRDGQIRYLHHCKWNGILIISSNDKGLLVGGVPTYNKSKAPNPEQYHIDTAVRRMVYFFCILHWRIYGSFPIFSGVEGRDWTQSHCHLDRSRLSISHSKLISLFVNGDVTGISHDCLVEIDYGVKLQ